MKSLLKMDGETCVTSQYFSKHIFKVSGLIFFLQWLDWLWKLGYEHALQDLLLWGTGMHIHSDPAVFRVNQWRTKIDTNIKVNNSSVRERYNDIACRFIQSFQILFILHRTYEYYPIYDSSKFRLESSSPLTSLSSPWMVGMGGKFK